ncbi:hypothetical protein Scep_001676 [Stephania cephalantha]|uniref:Uncharacterized protein n=1 Tax=Stephania cephalantha TaxID=152367 RepID=A0AAP0LB91_9MAGN
MSHTNKTKVSKDVTYMRRYITPCMLRRSHGSILKPSNSMGSSNAQHHGHVFGYGGGIKRKHLEESNSSYVKELKDRLLEKDELNYKRHKTIESTVDRLDDIEKERRQPSSGLRAFLHKTELITRVNNFKDLKENIHKAVHIRPECTRIRNRIRNESR